MFFSVNKKVVFSFLIRVLIVFSVFLVASCDIDENLTESFSDQDSYEARLDEAVILMDEQKYQEAKDIIDDLLLEKPGDEYLIELLASCYVGIAGIDSLSALEKIDNVTDSGDLDASDIIATILGDSDGNVTKVGITDTITNLTSALDNLATISNPTDDQLSQIALFSAYRVLANITSEYMRINGDVATLDLDFIDLATNITGAGVNLTVREQIAEDFTNMFKIPSTNVLYDSVNELADSIPTTTPNESDISNWIDSLTN